MTWFADLSPYSYWELSDSIAAKAVGWLDKAHPFPVAPPDARFLESLWTLSQIAVNQTRGLCYCYFCDPKWYGYTEAHGGALVLGSAEIIVFGSDGAVFLAPNLLFHYVKTHHYDPPEVFKAAVIENAGLARDAYTARIDQVGLAWSSTCR